MAATFLSDKQVFSFLHVKIPINLSRRRSFSIGQCKLLSGQRSNVRGLYHCGRTSHTSGCKSVSGDTIKGPSNSNFQYERQPPTAIKVEDLGENVKRIVAETPVRAPANVVWKVLTDYERLSSFVPNLELCERINCGKRNAIRLRQVACSQSVLWRLQAEAILEVEEIETRLGTLELRFTSISGDFCYLSGKWSVVPDHTAAAGTGSILKYDLSLQPRFPLPSAMVSHVVRAGLPNNIQAIVDRAQKLYSKNLEVSGLAVWAGVEENPALPSDAIIPSFSNVSSDLKYHGGSLPAKGPFWPSGSRYAAAAPITADLQRHAANLKSIRQTYLGTSSVPLPPAGLPELSIQQIMNKKQMDKEELQDFSPSLGYQNLIFIPGRGNLTESTDNVFRREFIIENAKYANLLPSQNGTNENCDANVIPKQFAPTILKGSPSCEVHLRRLDGLDYIHRRAIAAITIDAPLKAVWKVITDYDNLAEFVPNVASSQRIALPPNAPAKIIRIRQVGYKNMPYMCLHAETVLDLVETPCSEIQFRQVEGDLKKFQGKWMLSEKVDQSLNGKGNNQAKTQLKYAVEVIVPKSSTVAGFMEPVIERVVFEDIPSNLAAIKRRVEFIQAEREVSILEESGEFRKASVARKHMSKPRTADMINDFTVLAMELKRTFGGTKILPNRASLRDIGRSDLEKAIAAHGGPATVAERLGWKLQARTRKPKGYWSSLENVKNEIDEFIEESGLEPGVMPLKNDFVRAGRYDLARAVERWGGIGELTTELGYNSTSSSSSTQWQAHVSYVAAKTGLSGKQGLFRLAARTYRKDKEKKDSKNIISIRQEIDAW